MAWSSRCCPSLGSPCSLLGNITGSDVAHAQLSAQFIFGLVGATASVLIAYILPAGIFLSASSRPALLGQKDPAASAFQGVHKDLSKLRVGLIHAPDYNTIYGTHGEG